MMMMAVLTAIAVALTGCCSIRTPATGKNKNRNCCWTFFDLSLESTVYGDGFIVNQNK